MQARARVITLTTDFGTSETYAAEMKGVILGIAPEAVVVDGTHRIPPGDVAAGAYALRNLARAFPTDTIHLAVVDPGVGGKRRPLVVETGTCSLVGPDNGLFTRFLEGGTGWRAHEIRDPRFQREPVHPTFHGRDLFAPAAAHLATGVPAEHLGPPVRDLLRLDLPGPRRLPDGRLAVRVLHVDHFGNLILGLSREDLPGLGYGASPPRLRLDLGTDLVEGTRLNYEGASPGRPFFVWNGADDLEIAVDGGRASDRLGLSAGDQIAIEVLPGPGRKAGGGQRPAR